MDPYEYASGETHGEPKTPYPAMASSPPRGRATTSDLVLRARLAARRAALDPTWASRSPESKRLLIDLDLREGRR